MVFAIVRIGDIEILKKAYLQKFGRAIGSIHGLHLGEQNMGYAADDLTVVDWDRLDDIVRMVYNRRPQGPKFVKSELPLRWTGDNNLITTFLPSVQFMS